MKSHYVLLRIGVAPRQFHLREVEASNTLDALNKAFDQKIIESADKVIAGKIGPDIDEFRQSLIDEIPSTL